MITKQFYEITVSILAACSIALSQQCTVINEGIHLGIIDSYKTMWSTIHLDQDRNFSATLKGGVALGISLGYRFHGRVPIDGLVDASIISSSNQIDYQYPAPLSIQTNINRMNLTVLSLDMSFYFFTSHRIQPFVTLGYDIYLNRIDYEAKGYAGYHFENTYSAYGLHSELGIAYYLKNDLTLSAFIRNGDNVFSSVKNPATSENTVSLPSFEYGNSFSILF